MVAAVLSLGALLAACVPAPPPPPDRPASRPTGVPAPGCAAFAAQLAGNPNYRCENGVPKLIFDHHGVYSFTIPANAANVKVAMQGAWGALGSGNAGGPPGTATATFTPPAGQVWQLVVGGGWGFYPGCFDPGQPLNCNPQGYNGGGAAGGVDDLLGANGGGGGGATDLRIGAARVLVAGGGGGGGGGPRVESPSNRAFGGFGGGTTGLAGKPYNAGGGGGTGTQSAGGAGGAGPFPGAAGASGAGGGGAWASPPISGAGGGGGGGGGYFGGGGGAASTTGGGGGGGGSGFGPPGTAFDIATEFPILGNGKVVLTLGVPKVTCASVDGRLGDPYAFPCTATGTPAPQVSVLGNLPPGMRAKVAPPGLVIEGTPTRAGPFSFSVTADNGTSAPVLVPVSTTVTKAPTSASVVASRATSTYGEPITFDVRVAVHPPGVPPTGAVSLVDAPNPLATVALDPPSGPGATTYTASYRTTTLGPGPHVVSASIAGDANYTASPPSSPAIVTVAKAATSMRLRSLTNPSTYSVAAPLRAHLEGAFGTNPSGTVTFLVDGQPVAQATLDGHGDAAAAAPVGLEIGAHTVTATYPGDANHLPVSGALDRDQVVVAAESQVIPISQTPNPTHLGDPVHLELRVFGPGDLRPTGTVQLFYASLPIPPREPVGPPIPLVGGEAVFDLTELPVGSWWVWADYSGDAHFLPDSATLIVIGPREVIP